MLRPILISHKDLQEVLRVSRQTISNYVAEGMPRHSHGKYDLIACVCWFTKREQHRYEKMLEGLPLWEQTIRFKRALASIAEMELDGLKTSLVRRDEMDRVWDCIRLTTQKRMAKVPAEVAPRVFGNESMPAVVAILTKGIDDALEDISRTDPETGAVQYVTGGLNAGE